jgi:RTX calcium-binding nonapeptide repeat (4 copies)
MGEGDTLRNVENVSSGKGNDTLLGSAGSNRLDGAGGADTIDGREGNDSLFDGAGVDRVDAGPGDDELVTRDLYADTVSCGDGNDRALVDPGDKLATDCEGIARTPVDLIPGRYRLGMRDGRIVVRLACPDLDELPRTVARSSRTAPSTSSSSCRLPAG